MRNVFSIISSLFSLAKEDDGLPTWEKPSNGPIDLPEDQLRFIHDVRNCPYCRSEHGLFEGPSGAASVNLYCGNPDCDSRFNVVNPIFGFVPIGQFIGRCPQEFIARRLEDIGRR